MSAFCKDRVFSIAILAYCQIIYGDEIVWNKINI